MLPHYQYLVFYNKILHIIKHYFVKADFIYTNTETIVIELRIK